MRGRRKLGLLQSLLIHAAASSKVLLDTTIEQSDLVKAGPAGWYLPSDSQWMDITTLNQDAETLRALTICKKPDPSGNMVISPFVDVSNAASVKAEIKYYNRECTSLDLRGKKCKKEVEVYAQYVDSYLGRDASGTSPEWDKIGIIGDVESNTPNKTLTIDVSRRGGLFLAFKDYGSCTTIYSVRVYINECNTKTTGLATFEPTPIGPRTVTGKCVKHAVIASQFKVPQMTCTEVGWTGSIGEECVCAAGYEPDSLRQFCSACRPGTYKRNDGNGPCNPCPANSVGQSEAQEQCQCRYQHYRERPNEPAEPCIGLPGRVQDVQYEYSAHSASIAWRRPGNYNRVDLFYRLMCEECQGEECKQCPRGPDGVYYSVGPDAIEDKSENEVLIRDLKPATSYRFKLYTLNTISDFAELEGHKLNYEVIKLTTEGVESVPAADTVGSVKVALTTTSDSVSARVTWGSVPKASYEMMVRRNGEEEWPSIMIESAEYTLNQLDFGATYSISVRAIFDSHEGPWSLSELFKTRESAPELEDGTNPTVEQIAADKDDKNWVGLIVGLCVILLLVLVMVVFFVVRNLNRDWSKESYGTYGKTSQDGTMDAHFDLIPQIVRTNIGPAQIDGMSISSDHESLPSHADMTRGYYHERPVLLQYGYLTDEQFSLLSRLEHSNVLKCIGFAPSRQQLVFEYADQGTLPALMAHSRLDIVTVTRILRDISGGLCYLHSQQFLHRQLTSYNVFINGVSYEPKLAKYLSSNDVRPDYRRSAPEIWEFPEYSSAGDVWSLGTIMWETMAAYSGQDPEPYRGFSEAEILDQMKQGRHLPRPSQCPQNIYQLIVACWSARPNSRPTIEQVYRTLDNILAQMDPNGSVAV